jgi:hypothetical protein
MNKSIWKKLAELFKAEEEAEKALPSPIAMFCEKLGEALKSYGEVELPPEHPAHALKALHKEMSDFLAAAPADDVPAEPAPAEGATAGKPAEEPAWKSEKEGLAKREVDLAKKLADTEAILKAERDEHALAGMVTVLKSLKGVSVNPEGDAPIFKRLSEVDKAAYSRMMEILNGAAAVSALAEKLGKDLGSPLPGDKQSANTAWMQIEAEADALVGKGETKVTKAQAIDIVMKKRPDLVKQHYAETSAQ